MNYAEMQSMYRKLRLATSANAVRYVQHTCNVFRIHPTCILGLTDRYRVTTQKRVGHGIVLPRGHNGARLFSTSTSEPQAYAGNDTVALDLKTGSSTARIRVKPSYIQKPKAVENLLKSLPALLTDAAMPIARITSFSTKGWDLDESADTIHRYAIVQPQDIPRIMADIKAASDVENHDPHVHVDDSRMAISCTTHVPPGLSMKDIKLAHRIDEILKNYSIDFSRDDQNSEADILTFRQRGREHSMEAVRQAKVTCGCG